MNQTKPIHMKSTENLLLMAALLLPGCSQMGPTYNLSVTNELTVPRKGETVALRKSDLGDITCDVFTGFSVQDTRTGNYLLSQFLDEDLDGEPDYLLFQPDLGAGETRTYHLVQDVDSGALPVTGITTFSRFVPERTDDYAWENDRVAFRTYGPTAEQMVVDKTPGGTLSSGIDCWLKRVDHPIINKWYRETLDGTGSYHEDTGEGLDDFHVGPSRGCGGVGVWSEAEKKLYTSRNFKAWKTIATGPIRTLFTLTYAPWPTPYGMMEETKVVSLDLGSNLTRFEVLVSAESKVNTISAGITLHEKDGNISTDDEHGWFSYWQPHGDSELGMGIVVPLEYLAGSEEYVVDEPDQSHLLVHLRPVGGRVVYYAGFGWKKSGQVDNEQAWIDYLQAFAEKIASPIKYQLIK
jgi:hypothetical protein